MHGGTPLHYQEQSKDELDKTMYAGATEVSDSDEAPVERWSKNNYASLMCALLISATIAAFNVESLRLLHPEPTGQTTATLAQIFLRPAISGHWLGSSSVDSTQPASRVETFPSSKADPFQPPVIAVWLNIIWVSSFIFCLSAVAVGVHTWSYEWRMAYFPRTSRSVAHRRQTRLNHLKVTQRADALFPLFLTGMMLFVAGLLMLLHNTSPTVGIIMSILVATLLALLSYAPVPSNSLDICCYCWSQLYFAFAAWSLLSCILSNTVAAALVLLSCVVVYLLPFWNKSGLALIRDHGTRTTSEERRAAVLTNLVAT